jgi:hypothetical protein
MITLLFYSVRFYVIYMAQEHSLSTVLRLAGYKFHLDMIAWGARLTLIDDGNYETDL